MNTPITIYTEMTPNPVTMKFVLNFLLIDEEGESIEFRTRAKAAISPIAKKYLNSLMSLAFLLLPILLQLLEMKVVNGLRLCQELRS